MSRICGDCHRVAGALGCSAEDDMPMGVARLIKAMHAAEERALAAEQKRDELRAHMFNIAVVAVPDPRDGVSGQRVVDAVVDIAANRRWLLDEHVPELTTALADLREACASRDQQLAAAKEEIARLKQDLKDARAVIENLWSTTNA